MQERWNQLNPPASMRGSMFYMRARRRLPGNLNTVMRYGSAHNLHNERIDMNTCQDNEKGDLAKDPKRYKKAEIREAYH